MMSDQPMLAEDWLNIEPPARPAWKIARDEGCRERVRAYLRERKQLQRRRGRRKREPKDEAMETPKDEEGVPRTP